MPFVQVYTHALMHAGEHLQESFPVLQQVFLASLKDSSAEVRRTALQAVASMVPWLDQEPHIALFKDLVPLTIQVGPTHVVLINLQNPLSSSGRLTPLYHQSSRRADPAGYSNRPG